MDTVHKHFLHVAAMCTCEITFFLATDQEQQWNTSLTAILKHLTLISSQSVFHKICNYCL